MVYLAKFGLVGFRWNEVEVVLFVDEKTEKPLSVASCPPRIYGYCHHFSIKMFVCD